MTGFQHPSLPPSLPPSPPPPFLYGKLSLWFYNTHMMLSLGKSAVEVNCIPGGVYLGPTALTKVYHTRKKNTAQRCVAVATNCAAIAYVHTYVHCTYIYSLKLPFLDFTPLCQPMRDYTGSLRLIEQDQLLDVHTYVPMAL